MAPQDFKPQKSVVYNQLLPYSDQLDGESQKCLAEIKYNLGRAIVFKEMSPGILYWGNRLSTFMKLYGRHFSKEDHINFIHIFYDLMTTPELDSLYVIAFGHILRQLLKKLELISREDLVLDWKPLHKLVEFVLYSKCESAGLKKHPPKLSETVKYVVALARTYFSDDATQEMLDEWRPLLCPFDVTFIKGLFYLTNFLPTSLPPDKYDKGFRLWFDELIGIWMTCTNMTRWEENIVKLFSRLAKENIGHIDWTPYVSKIFTRLQKVFNIPIANCQPVFVPRDNGSLIHSFVVWITSILGSGSGVQEHLEIMFQALESFYHPSNFGRYSGRLQRCLSSFPKEVVKRIHREKFRKDTWETPIPEEAKLTDDDLTKFVECLKPAVMLSVFNKFGSFDAASALQHLALIKPDIVLPSLIDKLYMALDTLTEPHQLTATLSCATSVGRSLVRSQGSYTAGRAHVLPLLMSVLPGIDPNDFRKAMSTFTFISTMVCLVPIVDCSEAVNKVEMTEEEKELCLATSQFEDFVLQFTDRCFVMIENSSFEQTSELDSTTVNVDKRTSQEGMMGMGVASTFHAILMQCSPKIFESSLQNLFRFCTAKMLETKIAGKMASDMCRAAAKTNAEATLKLFLRHCCSVIEHIFSVEDISKDEEVDDQLLWNLQIVAEMVRCGRAHVLDYREDLLKLAHSTLHLKCKEAAEMGAKMLENILRTLSNVYPLEWRSVFEDFGKSPSEHLFIRDWGKSGDLFNLNIDWHIPTQEEQLFCKELLDTFFQPELKKLEKVVDGSETLPREELEQCLNICHRILSGATTLLPDWDKPLLENVGHKTMVGRGRHTNITTVNPALSMGEENSRARVAELMHKLVEKLLSDDEDDTKALQLIIKIYEVLVLHHGGQRTEFDLRWRSFTVVKKAMEDKLAGKKKRVRGLLIERVKLQHEMRLLDRVSTQLTTLHKVLMEDMLRLATSHYSQVRIKAQRVLSGCIDTFDYLARTLLPSVVEKLRNNPDISHEEFKGALYVMLNNRMLFLTTHYWEVAVKVWPALIRADHSEKPSIISLIESVGDKMVKRYDTVAITRVMPDDVLKLGDKLLRSSNPLPGTCLNSSTSQCLQLFPSEKEIAEADTIRQELHDTNLLNYKELVNEMASMMKNENLRWRYMQICFRLFAVLIRYDQPFPQDGIRLCVQYLTHDALAIRKIAITAVGAILEQQKRPRVKVAVSPYALANQPEPSSSDIKPGTRPDNNWLQYVARNVPSTPEDWERHTFVDKTHWGYYAWPKELMVYAPTDQQPRLGRTREQLNEDEQIFYDSFSSEEFVNKFVGFLSLEDRKGKDKFDGHRSSLFKGLFRNFDTSFMDLFKPHLERLLADSQESSQRCALEITTGLIRGSKHWDFEKLEKLWEFLIPLLRKCLGSVSVETFQDWGTFIASSMESRDPNRLHPLIQLFLEDPLSSDSGSFADSSRLYLLQGVLGQQEWRVAEPLHQMLAYVEPLLGHSYKNVRDRLGSVLCTFLMYDLNLPNSSPMQCPTRKEFIQRILPRLTILQDLAEKTEKDALANAGTNCTDEDNSSENDPKKEAMKLLKTVSGWILSHAARTINSCPEEMFDILPLIISLEYQEEDPELQHYCQRTIQYLSQMELSEVAVRIALDTVKQLSVHGSWHARKGALSYLQVMVFANLFHIARNEGYVRDIKDLVVNLLVDEQLEVREMAGETLSGLVHNGFFSPVEEMQSKFASMATTSISKKKKKKTTSEVAPLPAVNSDTALIRRHAGVLGLASCVKAFPYDVPQWMPQMLLDLGTHLHDPNPIQTTVKKVLSEFRRTHHDNWYEHKQMFTEDQLLVLTDLLVSPCYYA